MKTKPVVSEPPLFVNRLSPTMSKRVVKQFLRSGSSTHSAQGVTVPAILRYCLANDVPFRLEHHPKLGSHVVRLPKSIFT